MANTITQDYLGHPCQTSAAIERFDEQIVAARKLTRTDPREISRRIGMSLQLLQDRLDHQAHSVVAAREMLPDDTDSDKALAILVMAEEYHIESSNAFSALAGLVLLALDETGPRRLGLHP